MLVNMSPPPPLPWSRVSKVYTDSVGGRMSRVWETAGLTDSLRIPPDGQEAAAGLLMESRSTAILN